MLSDAIALIGIAAVLGVEAWKAEARFAKLAFASLAAVFVLCGLFIEQLAGYLPELRELIANIFSEPASWFVLIVALFIVARPIWTSPQRIFRETSKVSTPNFRNLGVQSANMAHRISDYRCTKRLWRDTLPPFEPLINDAIALSITFEKLGFVVPDFETNQAERIAVGVLAQARTLRCSNHTIPRNLEGF